MITIHRCLLTALAAVAVTAGAATQPPAAQPTDPGWPRTFRKGGSKVIVHQPQVDAWKDHAVIRFRCALEVTPAGADGPSYGVAAVEADTTVSDDSDTVYMTHMKVAAVNFPGMPEGEATALQAVVRDLLPSRPMVEISLSRVLAYMHDSPKPAGVQLNLQPPPIYYSDTPAILVVFMGQPQFQTIKGTRLMYAVNTNWLVVMDQPTKQYYLLDGKSWLTAPDPLKGPWSAAGDLPPEFQKLPKTGEWADVQKCIPGAPVKVCPAVYASTKPAELIVTNGAPSYTSINGTSLMYVSNPLMPVFMNLTNSNYYYLVAGRWFRAPALGGPWSAASADLPAEFARIPADSPVGFVLPSVPGTIEAKDAILLAQVPHKTTVQIRKAKVDVTYDGQPKFIPIKGTDMKYAVNTGYQVVFTSGAYYCCDAGIWFVAPTSTGAWSVCTSVPAVIYTIPPTCPVYNVTYVKIYDSTATTVVCGYTSGYSGAYVATTGALMFGAGMLVGAPIADNDCWHAYYPCYYSYGCAPYYHYGYGGYYTGCHAHYGPYGGAGWAARYNPATGTYSRSGYAYGPRGAAGYHQAYNPWTNTYGAHAGATNGYRSWGASTVSRGDQWASAAHTTGPGGVTHGWAEDSSGQSVQAAHGARGTVAATGSGNLYVGHDGNVYRNTGSGWQTHSDGSWGDVQKPTPRSSGGSSAGDWLKHPQNTWNKNWKSNWSGGTDWKSKMGDASWQNRSSSGGRLSQWAHHDTLSGLHRDSFSRSWGNAASSWRSSGRLLGGGGFHGFGGRSGRGGFHGFGGGGFHGGFRR